MCRKRLSEGISKYEQLKKKSAATALNTVLPQRTHKLPSSEPHGATRQQAIAKTPANWFSYLIPRLIIVFVVLFFQALVCKSYSQKAQETLNLLVTEESFWALFYIPLYTFSYFFYAVCWMY
jgi:hypothetical protein